jgi:hypothetical protein
MPHVNLLYPFYPPEVFDEALPRLVEVCAKIAPFLVTLVEVRTFQHSSRKATLWLAPEPKEALIRLQAALLAGSSPGLLAGILPDLSKPAIGERIGVGKPPHHQSASMSKRSTAG